MSQVRVEQCRDIMLEFAKSTGLSGESPPRRYLWTDAYAVCNYLTLHRVMGEERFLELALKLVDQVHHVLGRHRPDDSRTGWISGLSEDQGALHPTAGGLRIGKKFNERQIHERPDPQREWEQDGQYFHYLTRWMHALSRMSEHTGDVRFHQWAVELAIKAHQAFAYGSVMGKRMYWKMSIDLSRPLVESMGHHDPLDGLVTALELKTVANHKPAETIGLDHAIDDMVEICQHGEWATDDALGIGGLLDCGVRLIQMVYQRNIPFRHLLMKVLHDSQSSLLIFDESSLRYPAEYRLAFRELGLAIGLHGLESVVEMLEHDPEASQFAQEILLDLSKADQIDQFWANRVHQQCRTWRDHQDINSVMLATSLISNILFNSRFNE